MSSIGGFFELPFDLLNSFPENAVLLNTGRNALEYILRVRKYKKIYLPLYSCDVLLQRIQKLGINYELYRISEALEPKIDFTGLRSHEGVILINYFATKTSFIKSVISTEKNLIVDNAQALFASPVAGADTFYSYRKYFGVPDGACLFIDTLLTQQLPEDASWDRMEHLTKRIDLGPESAYKDFISNEKKLNNLEIKSMSRITQAVIRSANLEKIQKVRRQNFSYLHSFLGDMNELNGSLLRESGTFCYPLLLSWGNKLRGELIKRKIFIPTYWVHLLKHIPKDSIEWELTNNLICLPIDQRYGQDHMDYILRNISEIGQ